ncbi:hypothetical protein [Rhodopirellula halodulae]|uniref:hypothetical protein n=1 Tax=Rhodopirellula halodulae TaxID=2894198 RepID=UPI001E5F6B1F|nr:hypothetical protein [Rhodopirellula sp. JC737]MCC9654322.1 hypothetical protein [Rhodopirellula sp. JC737]
MTERIWANLRLLRRGSMNATASNRLANATTSGLVTAEVVDTRSHAITANGIRWKPGDWAIYRKSKRGKVPGPRASRVKPNLKGDTYNYVVEKFWMVDEVHLDGTLTMRTTRGKTHRIGADDPNLSRPSWFARLRWRERFVAIESQFGNSTYAA